jgi:hypothetical protein
VAIFGLPKETPVESNLSFAKRVIESDHKYDPIDPKSHTIDMEDVDTCTAYTKVLCYNTTLPVATSTNSIHILSLRAQSTKLK